jgi:hypothetical protein
LAGASGFTGAAAGATDRADGCRTLVGAGGCGVGMRAEGATEGMRGLRIDGAGAAAEVFASFAPASAAAGLATADGLLAAGRGSAGLSAAGAVDGRAAAAAPIMNDGRVAASFGGAGFAGAAGGGVAFAGAGAACAAA